MIASYTNSEIHSDIAKDATLYGYNISLAGTPWLQDILVLFVMHGNVFSITWELVPR